MEFFKGTKTKAVLGIAYLLIGFFSNVAFSMDQEDKVRRERAKKTVALDTEKAKKQAAKVTKRIEEEARKVAELKEAMRHAARSCDGSEVKKLVKQGANVNDCTVNTRCAPIHWFAAKGSCTDVRMLLKEGADASATDKDGKTPLFKFLQSDVKTKESDPWMAFVYFVNFCNNPKNNQKPISFSVTDKYGNTLFHEAVANGSVFWVKKLIEEFGTKKKLALKEYRDLLFAKNKPRKIVDGTNKSEQGDQTALEMACLKHKETNNSVKKEKYLQIMTLLYEEMIRVEKEMVPAPIEEKEKIKEDEESGGSDDEYHDVEDAKSDNAH